MVVQPLIGLVVERMRRDAEFICDDNAVSSHASPRALAESLAILARPFDSLASSLLGSHYSSSPIVERAERLLAPCATSGTSSVRTRLWTTVAATIACALLAASPALSLSHTEPRLDNEAVPSSSRPMIVTDEREVRH
jgi:beta-lactamase regulating signal transducer with metallopeptidase domain